jgi:hypothetical protein
MKSKLSFLFICAALSASTFAEAQTSGPIADQGSELVQSGQSTAVQIPRPPAGKGQIVFFRPSRFVGAAISWKLLDGTTVLGKVGNGRYLVVNLEPGPHELVMDFGPKGTLRMEVDPDETYYIECGIEMGAFVNRPDLIPSTKEGFDGISGKLKPAKP